MTFSPQLEERFTKMVANYPPGRQRAALIPMLMYAQDEVGQITREVAEEISSRLGITTLQVDEVIGYYTMLRAGSMGKTHLQICTNISCLLTGGEELWEHACKKLGIGHNQVTADGMISLEEVECIGACSWAPALQTNYTFHHQMTIEKLDKLIDELRSAQGASREPKAEEPAGLPGEASSSVVRAFPKRVQ